jgi:DNA polymerase III epsilon subunit family exonuclease
MEFIAFDLETTGLETRNHHIIEIGAVRFKDFEPVDSYNQLVKPPVVIPPDSIRVHHITDEMVASAPPVEEVLGAFADFCGAHLLVAHNAKFDVGFLTAAIKKHQATAPTGPVIDSQSLAKRVITGLPSYRLSSVAHHLGISATDCHRATSDAEYCGRVFAATVQALQRTNHATDQAALFELSERKPQFFPQITPPPRQLDLF